MSNDLVRRLRARISDPNTWNSLVDEAADEIERLVEAMQLIHKLLREGSPKDAMIEARQTLLSNTKEQSDG